MYVMNRSQGIRRCRQLTWRDFAWREFGRKFASPINFYGWHEFEKWHRLAAEGWRSWIEQQPISC